MSKRYKRYKKVRHGKYKSGLEERVSNKLEEMNISYGYETEYVIWQPKPCRYTPDFICTLPDGIKLYIEAKGYFSPQDRAKMLAVKEQYPDMNMLMVFGNPDTKLSKRSKTSYADWCERNRIPWCRLESLSSINREGRARAEKESPKIKIRRKVRDSKPL